MAKKYQHSVDWLISAINDTTNKYAIDSEANVEKAVDDFLDNLAASYDEVLYHSDQNENQFQQHMQETWGHAIKMLKYFILLSERSGVLFSQLYDSEYEADYRFETLTRLHARACRVSREVLILL